MSAVFWKKVFLCLIFAGAVGMGTLLYGLYSGVDGLRHRDEVRLRTLQAFEELRDTTQHLTNFARMRVSMGNEDAERQYKRWIAIRDGGAPRPISAALSPGRTRSLQSVAEEQSLATSEREALREALQISRELSDIEILAMSRVAGLDMHNLTTPESRATAREALDLLFSEQYRAKTAQILRLLDNQRQIVMTRSGAEEDSALQRMTLQAVGLCVFFVITGASLMGIGYVGNQGAFFNNKALHRYLYILLLLMASLAVPIWFVYTDARQVMVDALEKRQALICREVYRELKMRSSQAMELAHIMAELPSVSMFALAEADKKPVHPSLRAATLHVVDLFSHAYTDTASTTLLGVEGQVLFSSLPASSFRDKQVLSPAALQRVQAGESFLLAESGPVHEKLELMIVAPILAAKGSARVVGAVMFVLDRGNSFQLWKDRLATEERMSIFVLAKDGEVILSSRGPGKLSESELPAPVTELVHTSVEGLRYYDDSQGQLRIGYFMPIPEFGWTVAVSSIFSNTMASVHNMLMRALAFGAGTTLLTIVFFSLLLQSMTRSLRTANERLIELAEGMGMYSWEYNAVNQIFSFNRHWHMLMELPGPPQPGWWALGDMHASVHPDDQEELVALLNGVKKGQYFQFEVRHINLRGLVRNCKVQGYVEEDGPRGKIITGVALDVTSRKSLELSEEKLRQSNERMTQLMVGAGIHSWEFDVRIDSFSYDAQWARNMRVSEAALPGVISIEDVLSRIHADSLGEVDRLLSRMTLGEYVNVDLCIRAYTEEYIWHRCIAQVTAVDDEGRAVAYSAMGYDISSEKALVQSEDLLRRQSVKLTEAHGRLSNLMRAVGMFMWEFDTEKNTLAYDAEWHRLMELPGPPIAGVWTLDYLFSTAHPGDLQVSLKQLEGVSEGVFINFDVRHYTYTQQEVWMRIMARVDKCDPTGKTLRMTGMGYDITAFKVVEVSEANLKTLSAELHAAKERLEGAVEAASMFTYDIDNSLDVVRHNAQWCRFWDLPGEPRSGEMPLSFLRDNLHPDSLTAFRRVMSETHNGSFSVELQMRVANGDWRWCKQFGRVEVYDAKGLPERVVGMGFDITSLKMQELSDAEYKQQLEALVAFRTAELEESRNQAQAASQAKTVFLSTVSHEIRTPMNAIVGFAHIFDRSNLSQSQKNHLEKIRLSAETLLGVINDVLDISKIEAGKLELERVAFSLHNTLDTVCSIVDFAASSKNLQMNIHVSDSVPTRLMGDPKRISQILLNLLNNAVKFTSYGSVSLDVRMEESLNNKSGESRENGESAAQPSAVVLTFSVVDTGIGLTDEQMGRLFQPFTQADSSVTRKYGGTGLGLAISKQLVEIMGGHIGVTSQVGQGSTFRFTLCLDVPTTVEAASVLESGLPTAPEVLQRMQAVKGMHVLVVEDNEINQEISKALLEEYGIIVDLADNGLQSIEKASKEKYACIFMDMQMPVMGGLQAAAALRHMGQEAEVAGNTNDMLRWMAHVPIVAMTANAMTEDKQRCLEAGMDDHIGKPIDPSALQRCLLQWLVK